MRLPFRASRSPGSKVKTAGSKPQMQIAHSCEKDQVIVEHEVAKTHRVPSCIAPQRDERKADTKLCEGFFGEGVRHVDVGYLVSCNDRDWILEQE